HACRSHLCLRLYPSDTPPAPRPPLFPYTTLFRSEGFTLGIAVIIFLQQVPMATGTEVTAGQNTAVAAWQALGRSQWPTVAWTVGLVLIVAAIVLLLGRWRPNLPGSLVAVVVATVIAEAAGLDIPRIGALPNSLPAPTLSGEYTAHTMH